MQAEIMKRTSQETGIASCAISGVSPCGIMQLRQIFSLDVS